MAKLPTISFVVLITASAAQGQSGRRIQPVSTPAPVAVEQAADYSESKPRPPKRLILPPSFRNVSGQTPNTNKTDSTAAGVTSSASQDNSDEVITVDTNLITIPVSVFDRNGLYIPNLKQADFKIFEDGKEQEIAYFGTTDKPFTVILLIDTSPSTNYKIDEIRQSAIAFVDQLKSQDKVMVIEFDGNVHVLTEATSDRQKIYKAIRRADFGYGTSLYDAVDDSLRKHMGRIEGRKAIVLFTDGVDTTSERAGYDSSLALAEESDALIFPIYYNTLGDNGSGGGSLGGLILSAPGTRPQDYAVGKRYLDELADSTGGRVFRPEATPGGLTAAFEGIAEELRRQYNVGYVPAETGVLGQRKQIKVRVSRPNLILRARDSYVVGAARKGQSLPPGK